MNKTLLILLFCFNGFFSFAQTLFSLKDCIKYAEQHSSEIKTSHVLSATTELKLKQSINTYIPSISISSQNNLSTGRVLDPTTYQFLTNRSVYDMSTAVGGTMTLFSGFERPRTIQKDKLNLQSALIETEKIKNDLALNVTALFLNLVLDKEAIRICENKISMLLEQESVIEKRVEYNVSTPGDLLNVQADITNAKVDLSSFVNQLNLDKVAMCELLEIDDWEAFDITTEVQQYEDVLPRLWNTSDVVASAYLLPQIKQSELSIDIAKKEISIASSAYWPTLKLNAGYGSAFSNARIKTSGEEYYFRDQLRDNASSYVTLSLNIPILSAITVSNTVKQKKLACERAGYELARTKLALDKEVKQAIVNANTAYEKYTLLATDEQKCKEALRQTKEKYDAGAETYYDYQIAIGNLFQAQAQRLQAKYEYIFRTKIIEFYSGISLY